MTEPIRGLVQAFRTSHLALSRYRPATVLPTRIMVFRAIEVDVSGDSPPELARILAEPNCAWSRFAVRPPAVHWVPGNHTTMLVEPHVGSMAKSLRGYLWDPHRTGSPAGTDSNLTIPDRPSP